jgi:phosphoglycolate phosphatase
VRVMGIGCDSRRALIRCVYTDLDGTLLGHGASLFRDADGAFSLLAARALEACFRADVEVVLKSGRRKAQVMEDARLLGQSSYIYEMGCGLVIDGEETLLADPELQPRNGRTTHQLIEDAGAPRLLFETYPGRLEHHSPWHRNREISHLMRGLVDAMEADKLLADHGHGNLRLVDNGVIAPKDSLAHLDGPPHVYHLIPRGCSKADAVARHMQARGYRPDEVIAVGDSREDLGVADVAGRFFLVANGYEKDPEIREAIAGRPNVEVTEARNGEGFYEAVVRSLAESR